MSARYPFSAIAGQDELKLALLLTAVDPLIGGLLAFGDRGTGKSTAVRALAALLPEIKATSCAYHCDPETPSAQCAECKKSTAHKTRKISIPVVDLPLGATEDRVLGSLNLEHALAHGEKRFEPGLLAQANRGYLYVDEVNLLEDHIVDLLLDVAQSGENVVEREGLSVRHPARIVLVGSGNPEEGELRPQLLDRFGLSVEVRTPTDVSTWVEIVKRRDAFERDPPAFNAQWAKEEDAIRRRIVKARKHLNDVDVPDQILERAAALCINLKTDGLRGQLTLMRAARALAAYEGAKRVTDDHLKRMAGCSLRHRLRRNPLDETGSTTRINRAVAEVLGA
jgi:magnesium chelatase subunit I